MIEIFVNAGTALWQVLAVGVLLGAGLPGLFALGLRSMNVGRTVSPDGATFRGQTTPAGKAGGYLCFGLIVAAALFGIVVIVFGKQLFGA
ncbi:MAG: hypothetical protein ACR2LI_00695 [Propionibacteriaceae bacterium]